MARLVCMVDALAERATALLADFDVGLTTLGR
jgi:hypothetical protein